MKKARADNLVFLLTVFLLVFLLVLLGNQQVVALPTPFQALSSTISFPDPCSSGLNFTLRSLLAYSTNSLSLPPYLREQIEASKATHNAVNFWETLPFPTGLSRQRQIHTQKTPRKCQSYNYCKDRVIGLSVLQHIAGSETGRHLTACSWWQYLKSGSNPVTLETVGRNGHIHSTIPAFQSQKTKAGQTALHRQVWA